MVRKLMLLIAVATLAASEAPAANKIVYGAGFVTCGEWQDTVQLETNRGAIRLRLGSMVIYQGLIQQAEMMSTFLLPSRAASLFIFG
jgi:hypothetical protein